MILKVIIILCGSLVALAEIPSYLHVCHRSDPKLGQCIADSVEALKPKLKEGIPELNVPPLEPLPLNTIKMRSGPNQARINADLSGIQIWGPTQLKVLSIKPNIPKKTFSAKVLIPHIHFKGHYDMDVQVLVITYKGTGVLTGNFTDLVLDAVLDYNLIEKDGAEYINFPKLVFKLSQGKTFLDLEDSTHQNGPIVNGMREVLNDNADLFINEIKPALEEGLSLRLTEIANNIAHSFPYDELLPN